jgi:hypothetical protein
VPALAAALKDRDEDVRRHATDALRKIGPPAVLALAEERRRRMQVKTVTYTEVMPGTYISGFKKMDTHMAEMLNDGWRVQSQTHKPAGKGILPGVRRPGAMIVTYVKD